MGAWFLRFVANLGVTVPAYIWAVKSFAAAYLKDASSDELGWMFFLGPLLLIPPILPWLLVSVPVAATFAFRNFYALVIGIPFAAVIAWVASKSLLVKNTMEVVVTDGLSAPVAIGDIAPWTFIASIWALVIVLSAIWFLIERKPVPSKPR